MRKVSGFTLIELLVVIVILGILAATALPKFIDLSGDARSSAVKGFKGAIESGSAINYAAKLAGNASAVAVQTCANLNNVLNPTTLPTGYSLSGTGWPGATTATGTSGTCSLEYSVSGSTSSAAITAIAVSV